MFSNNSNGSRAAPARGFMALFAIMLAMGLGLMARPTAAAPFAYVANLFSNNVSVIDTATNPPSVVATVPVGTNPFGVAVTPDGNHAYVTNSGDNTVSVIDTASNKVAATVVVGNFPQGVAVTPDGKHAYVANSNDNTVSVIDTAMNIVAATVPLPVGGFLEGVAVTPDGEHVYVTNGGSNNVSVIATVTNIVVGHPIAVGSDPIAVAVAPDGKHVYVVNLFDSPGTVSVIATATNKVVTTVVVGNFPQGVAVTPDGKHAYGPVEETPNNLWVIDTASNMVAKVPAGSGSAHDAVAVTPDGKQVYVVDGGSPSNPGSVSVLDTANNTVVATVPVGNGSINVGIVPPPPGVPFLAFNAALTIDVGGPPPEDTFNLHSSFTLSSTAPGIDPLTEPVTLQVGTFATTIPPGSFTKQPNGSFTFAGVIKGVSLNALIRPAGTLRYAFNAAARRASLTGTTNPVYVTLIIGGDSGATSAVATISP